MAKNIAEQRDAKKEIKANGRAVYLITPAPSSDASPTYGRNRFGTAATVTAPEATRKKIHILQTKFKDSEIDGQRVRITDLRFLCAGDLDISESMKIKDGNREYEIVNVMPLKPGETTILYKIQVR